MNQTRENHISIGGLIAFSESEGILAEHANARQHIEACPDCDDLYRYLKSTLPNFSDCSHAEQLKFDQCPQSDMDYLSLFLTFSKSRPTTETATQLFKHFNDCYSCCENFVSDWNDYLTVKNSN